MSEPGRKPERPPGREFAERLVIPCSAEFKRQIVVTAKVTGEPAAAWARVAIQDRLDHQIRIRFDGKENLLPLDYDY